MNKNLQIKIICKNYLKVYKFYVKVKIMNKKE